MMNFEKQVLKNKEVLHRKHKSTRKIKDNVLFTKLDLKIGITYDNIYKIKI